MAWGASLVEMISRMEYYFKPFAYKLPIGPARASGRIFMGADFEKGDAPVPLHRKATFHWQEPL